MKHVIILAGITLSACTTQQVQQSVMAGQLYCATRQTTVAVQTAGAPVIATGASKAYVDAACAAVQGVAVVPPADPSGVPHVTIPAVSVPL